ncbi:hypothetical protein [Amycolatopsis sp. GM8]|uniref:hypothetical protein n=1 Tax=Amycolatopsis sp. GM8 TaxID=2896530 RepID=UPI001F409262|nr:hypothetical protein [Amycolatopsis sp. GM8]
MVIQVQDAGHLGGEVRAAAETLKKRLATAETRLRRLQAAIEAGVDPAALAESISEAQAQRTTTQHDQ